MLPVPVPLVVKRAALALEPPMLNVGDVSITPYSDFSCWSYTLASLDPPPQPGNPRSRVHLIIIVEGAGGAARCPLNRSNTTSAPPPRNYESLRAGFHRGNTPGTRRVLHVEVTCWLFTAIRRLKVAPGLSGKVVNFYCHSSGRDGDNRNLTTDSCAESSRRDGSRKLCLSAGVTC